MQVQNVPVADAISSVAAALIAHTLSSEYRENLFLDWYRDAMNDPSITRTELVRDLTSVREALIHMGFTVPTGP
jgi:hypothetical protein